jgi:hypothetical protein
MIVLDESESLLNHFDEGTMKRKEIEIWELFDELLKHSKKLIMMDGDVSERTLNFASSYGDMTYIKNANNESNRSINLICNRAKWDMQLKDDLERFYKEDKRFRVCVASQSSTEAINLENDIRERFPHLCVKRLVGDDCGSTKKAMLENINNSLEEANVFIYSPTIESGVDITIPVKKLYGILSCKSNSQRAYLQMLARCRNLEDGRIDVMNSPYLKINNNHCFWRYSEVLELNQETVAPGMKFEITGSMLRLSQSVDTRRKNISVFNTVEQLNKHPSLFINYLRVLATEKGMGFTIQQEKEEDTWRGPKVNYRLNAILAAQDIPAEEYRGMETRKKMGRTTTDENLSLTKCFWKRYLVQDELDPELLTEFMFDNNPLDNFVSLVDIRNHEKEDNLQSAKFVERSATTMKLLRALGFESVVDSRKIGRDDFLRRWADNVVSDPDFQSKRLNELWGLLKSRRISKDMTIREIIPWINMLLKPFGILIKADHGRYFLGQRFDILGLIQRKNSRGKYYNDGANLLGQVQGNDDLFIDEDTGEIQSRERLERRKLETLEFEDPNDDPDNKVR